MENIFEQNLPHIIFQNGGDFFSIKIFVVFNKDLGEIFSGVGEVVELNFDTEDTAEGVEHFGGREVKFLAEDFCKESALAAAGFEEFGIWVADSGLNFRDGEHFFDHPVGREDFAELLNALAGFNERFHERRLWRK